MEAVRSLCRLSLVIRASGQRVAHSDALDHEDLVLEHHIPLRLRRKPAAASIDLARLQRATQCSRQSTGRRSDDIVKSRRMVRVLAGSGSVVLSNLSMGAEYDRVGLRGQIGLADRPTLADDPDTRHVLDLFGHPLTG